jgi:hypothetical protein
MSQEAVGFIKYQAVHDPPAAIKISKNNPVVAS